MLLFHAALPESTSSIDTEASCSPMEVIHDFWREWTGMTPLLTHPSNLWCGNDRRDPLCPSTDGEGELTLGADGVPAPWQRRQRRRMGLASSSASAVSAASPSRHPFAAHTRAASGPLWDHQPLFLRLASWTRTCPSLRGSHLTIWTRSGRLDAHLPSAIPEHSYPVEPPMAMRVEISSCPR